MLCVSALVVSGCLSVSLFVLWRSVRFAYVLCFCALCVRCVLCVCAFVCVLCLCVLLLMWFAYVCQFVSKTGELLQDLDITADNVLDRGALLYSDKAARQEFINKIKNSALYKHHIYIYIYKQHRTERT